MSTLYVDNLQPNLGSQVVIPDLKPLAGSVVQVVQGVHTGNVTTTGTSFIATGLYVDITPTKATSKVLVTGTFNNRHNTSSVGTEWIIKRDTTDIITDTSGSGGFIEYNTSGGNTHNTVSFSVLDDPATTSSVRYEVYIAAHSTGGEAALWGWGKHFIQATEIAQ